MNFVNLKRSQWECYTDTPDSIIETINIQLSDIFKCESDPVEAQRQSYEFMMLFKEWGFADSEPMQALTDRVNYIFRSNLDRWECMKAGWAAS
tara:strand:+ start:222 stop:500 length:279 start_codon:yes stop_codon:yes gene_type:complete